VHQLTEGRIRHLRQQVQMIAHPAVGVQSRAEAPEDLADDLVETLTIVAGVEDPLPVVASQHDVIETARNM
jgi:hypothetical protein